MYKADVLYEIRNLKSCVCLTVLVANLRLKRWWLQPVVISRGKDNKISNTTEVRCPFCHWWHTAKHLTLALMLPSLLVLTIVSPLDGAKPPTLKSRCFSLICLDVHVSAVLWFLGGAAVLDLFTMMLSRIHFIHHMELISDNLMGRYFCGDAAEHQEALLKNHPRNIKNAAKLNAAPSVICVCPRLHNNIFRWKLKALVPFGPSVYTETPETGAMRKSGVFRKCRRCCVPVNAKICGDFAPEHYSCSQLSSG